MTNYTDYKECIELCLKCASVCNYCASSCTKENDVKMMAACIQLDMECASICYAAAQLMSLGSPRVKEICNMCAAICEACAFECGKHNHEHCKQCASICKECSAECRKM